MSWAKLTDDASVSPATTARMVAKATAAMMASMTVPPSGPKKSDPIASASCRAAVLPLGLCSRMASGPTRAAAPKPRQMVIR